MEELLLYIILAISCVSLLLLSSFLFTFLNFWKRIEPLLDRFTGKGGDSVIPTPRQIISIGLLKLMESFDFSKIGGNLFGGGGKRQ